jgi:hypothetical protein
MISCRCPAPACGGHDGSGRNGSPAASLPRQRMSCSVLDLSALRSRTTLLQPRLPCPSASPATALRQLPPSAESRRTAGPSRPATGISAPAGASTRDGSGFPFDLWSGNMRMWEPKLNADSKPGRLRCRFPSVLVKKRTRALVAMHRLRPERPGSWPVPTISTIRTA